MNWPSTAIEFNQLKNHYQEQLSLSEDLVALMETALSKDDLICLNQRNDRAQIDKLANLGVSNWSTGINGIFQSMGGSKPQRKVFDAIAAD